MFSAKFRPLLLVLMIILQMGLIAPVLKAEAPDLAINKYSVSPDTIVEGEEFTLTVNIQNEAEEDLSQVSIELGDNSGYTLIGSKTSIQLAELMAPGQSESFSIDLLYQGGGDGQLPLRFTYNKDNYPQPIREEKYLSVPVDGEGGPEEERLIAIEDKETIYTRAGSEVKASIKLKNLSNYGLEEVLIKASLDSDSPFSFPAEQMFYFRSWDSLETKKINIKLSSRADAADGTYVLHLEGQFIDSTGVSRTNQENLYIQVQDTQITPQLLMEYQLDEMDYLTPGQGLQLPVRIRNEGQIAARDITITLSGTSPSGIFLSSGSNKRYVDTIRGGSEKPVNYLLDADSSLPNDRYPLLLQATYTDQSGKSYKTELEIELEVKTETASVEEPIQNAGAKGRVDPVELSQVGLSRLKVGNIRFTGDMKPGKLINLYCTYYNTGKGSLSNLIIKLEGNFKAVDKTVFMGDMEQNSSGYYETAFEPQEAGEILGQLVFSYQDGSGEPLVVVEPFSLNIAEDSPAQEIDNPISKGISPWLVIIPIIAVAAALAVWQMQRKRQQLPEASSKE
ncbi:MAG: COG1361 S-layer family protein [Syntrophomonadaceae bacterium]|jgi:hypothetical protein|nr:hypothetical protein [Syntrophomonadaceae bacterium]